jgi:energy-coupling factor transporter ATP-binding protein EcfA2
LKIKGIAVTDLFGVFNHSVDFNIPERITIIHGPNGFGKSALLSMLSSLFQGDYQVFLHVPFAEFTVFFSDGRILSIKKTNNRTLRQESFLPDDDSPNQPNQLFQLTLMLHKHNDLEEEFVSGSGNVFSGGMEQGTLSFGGRATADLHGNYIYKGDNPYAVEVLYAFYEMVSFDLTDNYWGTTDIETIEEWIWDWNDDPSIHGTVDFLPLADGDVSTDQTTLDRLKAMYR